MKHALLHSKALRLACAFCLLTGLLPNALAQNGETDRDTSESVYVGEPVRPSVYDVDLRDLPIVRQWEPGDPIKDIPVRGEHETAPPETVVSRIDPLLSYQEDAKPADASRSFAQPLINFDGQGYSGVNPADPAGAAGIDFYIQAINGQNGATYVVYNKATGAVAAGPFNMSALGGGACAANPGGDPIVVYDSLAGRWLIAEFTNINAANTLCVYVSQTGNPVTGGWFNYAFNAPNFPDYPKFGVWNDAYYVSTNDWTGAVNIPAMYALNRNAMLAGNPAGFQRFQTAALGGFNFQALAPADVDGPNAPPAGSPGIFIRHVDDELHGGSTAGDFLEIFEFDVDWANPANSGITGPIQIGVADFDSTLCANGRNCFNQPGSTNLDSLREVVMNRLSYRNQGARQTLVGNFTVDANGANRGGIRWFELRNNGGGWALFQEGPYAPTNWDRWLGSIAMDNGGNIVMGFNRVASVQAPSLHYVGRRPGDPLNTLPYGGDSLVSGSGGGNGSNRYGDYSTLTVDPVDDCTFWFTGMYNTGTNWRTRIGSFSIDCSPANQNPTVVINSPNDGAVLSNLYPINLSGTATDPEEGTISSRIEWTSASQGFLGTGANISVSLNPGGHPITATVEDTEGGTSFYSIIIEVGSNCRPSSAPCYTHSDCCSNYCTGWFNKTCR